MKYDFNQFKNELKKLRPSEDEKASVRSELLRQIQQTRTEQASQSSSFLKRLFIHPAKIVVILLVILFSSGTGLTYAANNAMPGDPLYGVKVNVNENVKGWMIQNPQEKAKYEIKRAARRLEEAAQLAVNGRLDAEAARSIQKQLGRHTKQIDKNSKEIQTQEPEEELEVSSKFTSELSAHSKVLAEIKKKKNINGELGAILDDIEQKLAKESKEQKTNVLAIQEDDNSAQKDRVNKKEKLVKTQISELASVLKHSEKSMKNDLSAISSELDKLEIPEGSPDSASKTVTRDAATSTQKIAVIEQNASSPEDTKQKTKEKAISDTATETSMESDALTTSSSTASSKASVSTPGTSTSELPVQQLNKKLSNTVEKIKETSFTEDPALIALVRKEMNSIKELLKKAKKKQEQGNYGEAFAILQNAYSQGEEMLKLINLKKEYGSSLQPNKTLQTTNEVPVKEVNSTSSSTTSTTSMSTVATKTISATRASTLSTNSTLATPQTQTPATNATTSQQNIQDSSKKETKKADMVTETIKRSSEVQKKLDR